jgi:aspartyl-tRNA(Asn)/glutamyl-tRNA(Gln) amidotransferase subunit A
MILGSPIKDKNFTPDDISQMIRKSNNLISLKDVTIGIPKEFILNELNDDIRKAWQLAIDMFIDAGAKVVDVSLPLLRLAVPCYYILACAEASSNLSRYDGIRYGLRYDPDMAEKQEVEIGALHKLISKNRGLGFGPEVIKRILTGSYVLSESAYHQYYGNADRIRNGIRKEMTALFSDNNINMIACPTSPTLPYSLNDPPDPCQMLLNDLFTVPANLTGSPAISIPISVSYSSKYDTSLPIGIQLMGPSLSESQLFQSALALEQRAQFNKKHTPEWLM